jgi:hypothetical protein
MSRYRFARAAAAAVAAATIGCVLAPTALGAFQASTSTDATFQAAAVFRPRGLADPVINGTAQEGQQLVNDDGQWSNNPTGYSDQWARCDASGATCANVAGATSRAYQPSADDVGSRLCVTVIAHNAGGDSAPRASAATAVVLPAAPTNTTPPALSGTAKSGEVLTTDLGTWSHAPASYVYAWLRCDASGGACAPIAGATGASYQATDADVGLRLRSRVTATNKGGSTTAQSAPTAAVDPAIVNTAPPVVSGTTQRTATLTVSPGTWSPAPTTTTYRWQRCDANAANCVDVAGASSSSYTLTAGDIGSTLRSIVAVSTAAGGNSATSAASAVVTELVAPTVSITSVPSGNAPSGQIRFTTGGLVASVKCQVDAAAAADCVSPPNVSVAQRAGHTFKVTVTNAAGSASKTATWVNTSYYTSQGYQPGPVNWGVDEDCPRLWRLRPHLLPAVGRHVLLDRPGLLAHRLAAPRARPRRPGADPSIRSLLLCITQVVLTAADTTGRPLRPSRGRSLVVPPIFDGLRPSLGSASTAPVPRKDNDFHA